jgi:hypothetical protein
MPHSLHKKNKKKKNVKLPQEDGMKYLRLHCDRTLTWYKHIFAKRKQQGITLTKMYWLLGRKSKRFANNKLLIYKTIFKPICTYGMQLWGMTSTSNVKILDHFKWKALCMIVDAPCNVPNTVIRRDLLLQLSTQCSPQCTPKRSNSKPHGATRQQVIVKTPAKSSSYKNPGEIVTPICGRTNILTI